MDAVVAGPLLEAKESRLLDELDELTRVHQNVGSISFGKRIGDGTSMAVDRLSAVQAHDSLTALLHEVRRARAKVAEGSYGVCDVCGSPIPDGRLEVRPWATRCVADS